jgi:hypothetical protein
MTTESKKDKLSAKPKVNIRNTVIKFALDQTLGATFNTIFFIAGIGALKGKSTDKIIESIKRVWYIKLETKNFLMIFHRIRGLCTSQGRKYGLHSQ